MSSDTQWQWDLTMRLQALGALDEVLDGTGPWLELAPSRPRPLGGPFVLPEDDRPLYIGLRMARAS